jgi:PilZ domain
MILVSDGEGGVKAPGALKLGPSPRPPLQEKAPVARGRTGRVAPNRSSPAKIPMAPPIKPSAGTTPVPVNRQGIPTEADFIISALEAGSHAGFDGKERRKADRFRYRVAASLKLFSDSPQSPPWTLYVRDVGTGGLGFVTRHRLPLGYGGILTIVAPEGKTLTIDCTLLRCREAIQGWFEGSMYFNREQGAFDGAHMPKA